MIRLSRKELMAVAIGFGAVAAVGLYAAYAPANWNLAKPVDLTATPNILTEWKLELASSERCYAALADAGLAFRRLPDEVKGGGCILEDVAVLDRSLVSWGEGVTLRCRILTGLALWERHSVILRAEEILGRKVVRIRHYGTYACRNINNRARGPRSEHALADAIDIAGFILDNGEEVSVKRHWYDKGPKGRFLRAVRRDACRRFNAVLSPDYNAEHHDHFHFDNGSAGVCR
jgi:hypothetical protein